MIKKSSFYKKGGFWNFRFQISDFRFNLIKLFIPVILIAGFFVPYFSFAWDSHFTHRALTYEAGEFFNYFNDSQLSEEEINWLMQGAQEEDTPPRWINHFYNPITGEGWTGDKLGENSPGLVKFLSGFFLSSRTALSAKNWAKNRSAQADYSLYKGDQTWQKAIDAYLEGDRESAFVALGHILHLLEDMTVPDHTRGDTHAGIVGDKGSPLENWAKEYNKDKIGKLQTAEELYKSGQKPKDFSILENYFDLNAKYSSENFFSEDTINENLIAVPELIIGENQQIYGYINNYPVYTVKDNKETINDPQILTAYWQRLSKQAVISSAGVINLFFKEAERQSKLPQKMTKKSNTTTNTIWSPFGELTKLYNTAVQFAQGFFPQSTKADESVNDEIVTSQANSGDERLSEQASPPSEKGDLGGFNNNQSTIINQQSIIPDPTPASESITEPETNFYVSQVIDGDTITLNSGEDVRLIGMDTPERGEECFEEAKQKMESMVLGKNIRLEKDTSETDKYNRLLRYIYIDGVLVNAEMLKEGYAHLMMIRPDTKYYSAFKSYEEEAKFFERGCLFQKEGVGGADPIDETPVYTGWSSAGGSSKPAPQAPKEETPTSTPETATSTLEVILEDITSTSTPQTSTSTPQT
ncbi:thermonuclease family protein, partial [Candidatus Parcubacteria bacterium]|nr:thermonuclease family protein [Candidatus Parcubacteria bacterium]